MTPPNFLWQKLMRPRLAHRLLWFHLVVFIAALTGPRARAETSILLSLMQTSQAIVMLEAENAAVYGDAVKPFLDPRTGTIVLKRRVRPVVQTRAGAGVILHPSGLIITNAHTVQQAARITVTLYDDSKHRAEILQVVPGEDLALLKIDAGRELPAVPLGNSDEVQLDAKVYTIGGSPLLRNTISEGHVSALGVPRGQNPNENIKFLQVTFNIYQGDSGSPLLDADGRLLGIMMGAQTHQDRTAYAIPSNSIAKVVQAFLDSKKNGKS